MFSEVRKVNRKVRQLNLTLRTNAKPSEMCVAYLILPSTGLALSVKENMRYKASSQNG